MFDNIATMWWSLFVLLLFTVSGGYAANSEVEGEVDMDLDKRACGKKRKDLLFGRKTCIYKNIAYQLQNDTSESDGHCTNLDVVEIEFSRQLTNISQCKNLKTDFLIASMETRLGMLRRLHNATRNTDYFKNFLNSGVKCVKENQKDIEEICLKELLKDEMIYKDNLSRLWPRLYYGSRSCAKSSLIVNCAQNIMKKNCSDSNVGDFVLLLENVIKNNQCNETKKMASQTTKRPSTPLAGIIVGILLGAGALLVLAFYASKKLKKLKYSRPSLLPTESYRVSYQHQSKEQ